MLPAAPDFARLETTHYALQKALYLRRQTVRDGVRWVWNPAIPEPEWNHAAEIGRSLAARGDAALDRRLAEVARFFAEHGLPPAVAVNPGSAPIDLPRRLEDRGWRIAFRHLWLVAPTRTPPAGELTDDVELTAVQGDDDLEAFLQVFAGVYGTGEPLAPGYAQALRDAWRRPTRGVEVAHFLARRQGEAVGIGTAIHGPSLTGLYNLAVLPEHRRRGVGTALLHHRLAEAARRGHAHAFLQTELDAPSAAHRRCGLEATFTTVGWTTGPGPNPEETP